jgi:hypothetical protein
LPNYRPRMPAAPKIDQGLRERLQFKKDERLDNESGTPGIWVQNGSAAPLYIPGWVILAEQQIKRWAEYPEEAPREMIVQVGSFWKGAHA